jgi:hypothetical protein
LARDDHPFRCVLVFGYIKVQRKEIGIIVGLYPADPPSNRGGARIAQTALGTKDVFRVSFVDQHIFHDQAAAFADRQLIMVKLLQKLDLLQCSDAERAIEPKVINPARDILISVGKLLYEFRFALLPNLPSDFLVYDRIFQSTSKRC